MSQRILTQSLGYPRIGPHRELKRVAEAFWKGRRSAGALEQTGRELRKMAWLTQRDAGIDLVPSNDFSLYDQMLDASCLVGNVPRRFSWDGSSVSLDLYFRIARGASERHGECGCGVAASEMTKWFDTNYHYLVPEFDRDTRFRLCGTKPFDEFIEALALGIRTKPVLIGPLTYLRLGKSGAAFDRLDLLDGLIAVYEEILQRLTAQGAEWVQLDEPALALDLDADWQAAFAAAYGRLRAAVPSLKLMLATYFGGLGENLDVAAILPVDALHIDLTRADELKEVLTRLPVGRGLSLGVVDGRNIWRNDFDRSLEMIERTKQHPGPLFVAPSCSLLHVPVSLEHETMLDAELKSWLAFAGEKLVEVSALARQANGEGDPVLLYKNRVTNQSRRASGRIHKPEVKTRTMAVDALERRSPFFKRQLRQHSKFRLPLLPTTTIGSFPQTDEVRTARAKWRNGELEASDYERFLKKEIARVVRCQEELGIDVLVHGEAERNDMVEYFGEQLEGFAFTTNGWVQSYGSRCVKPPIIFGDVSRPAPMTVHWSRYAQSLTKRPMKGMLTGPITMLQWSFVRDDQPRSETARQIALSLRDEVLDLEAAGIGMIQIDEPALREALPLRLSERGAYLAWAVKAFRLTAAGVRDETQIHTHMCYCEFNDIIESIAALDADVISIETSRSNMELLGAFTDFRYPNEIGPGVYDIHSPRVAEVEEISVLLRKAAAVLPPENLWVNPDCGLKTRGWEETLVALRNMVLAAKELRSELTLLHRI